MTQHSIDTMPAATGEVYWRYEEPAPRNTKILILTCGDVAILGNWQDGVGHQAWSPLPKKRKSTEAPK